MARENIASDVVDAIDSRLFSDNTLATKLFKYYLILGLIIFFVPPLINRALTFLGIGWEVYAVLFPMLILGIVALFIFRSISKLLHPIEKMLLATRYLGAGKLDIDLDVKGYEEVEVLAKSIDRLRNSIRIARDYLGEGKDELADSVSHVQRFRSALFIVFSYLLYAALIIAITTVFYHPLVQDIFNAVPGGGFALDLVVIVMAMGFSVAIGFVVAANIGGSLRELAAKAEMASKGDFSVCFQVAAKGEIGELARNMADITNSLKSAYEEMEAKL